MSDKRDAKPSDEEHVRGQIAPPPDMSSCSDLLSTDAVADAELETLESVLRAPLPEADARYLAESGCQWVVERIAAIACEYSGTSGADPVLQGMVRPKESGDQPDAGSDPGETATMTPAPVPIELPQLGEYQLLEKLGQGGMGAVYKARHTRLDKIVAVKVLPPERMTDPQAVARFEREMKAVGRVDHPNIVRAMDAREIDGTHFLVMEYAAGMDLGDVLLQTGGLPIADACEIVRQVAGGLQCAHENGLIHRDIKPSNAILTCAGEVKILDLGLARLSAAAEVEGQGGDMTSFGTAMGTADYIAPEQAKDSHTADIRADIYSLGCTLYTLLAGRPPFIGPKYKSHLDKITGHLRDTPPPIGLLRVDVPPGLAMVINQMMAKDREARYATPQDVVKALTPFVAGADLNRLVSEAVAMKLGTQPAAPSSVGTEPGVSSAMSDTARRGKQANNAPAAAEMAGANGLPQTQPFAVSLSRRSRKPRAKRASALPRSRVLIGLGLLGAAILAGVIVITIRNREGKKVGELTVSDDNRVEVSHRPDTASAKPAESPASALPTGQWTPLVKSEEDLKTWQKQGTGSVTFVDGAVRVQDAALSYPTVAVDLVIRVNVKIEVNVQATAKLTLRETAAGSYAAVLEDGEKIVVGVSEGEKWRELKSAAVTLPKGPYVAVEFSAVGETLTVSIRGQKVFEVRDGTHGYGSPGLAVANGATLFKDVEVKVVRGMAEEIAATSNVEVIQAEFRSLAVSLDPPTFGVGQASRVTVRGIDASGQEHSLVGSSLLKLKVDPTTVASVDGEYLMGRAEGAGEVQVSYADLQKTAPFTVAGRALSEDIFFVSPSEITNSVVYELIPLNVTTGSDTPIQAVSADESVVGVFSTEGENAGYEVWLAARKVGQTEVTVSQNTAKGPKSQTVKVTVNDGRIGSLSFTPPTYTMTVGQPERANLVGTTRDGRIIKVVPDALAWEKQPRIENVDLDRRTLLMRPREATAIPQDLQVRLAQTGLVANATVEVRGGVLQQRSPGTGEAGGLHTSVPEGGKYINIGLGKDIAYYDAERRGLVIGQVNDPSSLLAPYQNHLLLEVNGKSLAGLNADQLAAYFRDHPIAVGDVLR